MPSLPIDLNSERLHDVSVPASFETTGAFEVELRNRGEAVHVHLHLDDDLSRVAHLDDGNHYVAGGDALLVPVRVTPFEEPVTGRLKVVTAYGAETAHVTITINPGEPPKPRVDVDESLAKPPQREQSEPEGFDVDLPTPPAPLAIGIIGLLALVVAGLVVDPGLLYLAVGIVIGGAIVGFAMRE